MRNLLPLARWVPFIVLSLASLWASARTSEGYRSPVFDWDLTWPAVSNALTKTPHITSMLLIFLLAALGSGISRLPLAAALSLVVAVGWEIVQMPTLGNNPRLADLAPDLVGIGLGWAVVSLVALAWRRLRDRGAPPGPPADGRT